MGRPSPPGAVNGQNRRLIEEIEYTVDTKKFELRDQAAYATAEAARYLRLPVATLRSWVVGRPYPKSDGVGRFQPLIRPASRKPLMLSFWNLIEAHVLRALRTEHDVSLREVRAAIRYAERELKIERLLLNKELRTRGGRVFLERYGELIDLPPSRQLALQLQFDAHLKRVEWGEWQFPVRLYPFVSGVEPVPGKPIAIDPSIAFGRPVILRRGISTGTIAERLDAGESVKDLAADYELEPEEIQQAVLYEREQAA